MVSRKGWNVKWMTSEQGQAIAAWASCALAVIAIIFALTVALIEQRRANRELQLTAEAEKRRRVTFVDTVLSVSMQAVELIVEARDSLIDEPDGDGCFPTAMRLADDLRPLNDTILSLRHASPFDANIAISLARIFRAIEAAMAVSGDNVLDARRRWFRQWEVLSEERRTLKEELLAP